MRGVYSTSFSPEIMSIVKNEFYTRLMYIIGIERFFEMKRERERVTICC